MKEEGGERKRKREVYIRRGEREEEREREGGRRDKRGRDGERVPTSQGIAQ